MKEEDRPLGPGSGKREETEPPATPLDNGPTAIGGGVPVLRSDPRRDEAVTMGILQLGDVAAWGEDRGLVVDDALWAIAEASWEQGADWHAASPSSLPLVAWTGASDAYFPGAPVDPLPRPRVGPGDKPGIENSAK